MDNNIDPKYFDSYEDLEIHKLMLEDRPRTDAYRDAIYKNEFIFKGKTVMDIGAGTGILSLFAMKAGAKKVYAVEASGFAATLKKIVELNDPEKIIEVVQGKAEEVDLPEKVDIIISEWMGFYLLHESMLNSVIKARDKHIEQNFGIIFPSKATIWASPCQINKSDFWKDVYGFDMSPASELAGTKPDIKMLEPSNMLSTPAKVVEFDLRWVTEEEIKSVRSRNFVTIESDTTVNSLAIWFDVQFDPLLLSEDRDPIPITLSTGPRELKTHWKQTIINLDPITVEENEIFGWDLFLTQTASNPRQYALQLEILDPSTDEHPDNCDCGAPKCTLIQALIKKEEAELS